MPAEPALPRASNRTRGASAATCPAAARARAAAAGLLAVRLQTRGSADTWVRPNDPSRYHGRRIGEVPAGGWDPIAGLGFDTVRLMGVWEGSPAGAIIARKKLGIEPEFRRLMRGISIRECHEALPKMADPAGVSRSAAGRQARPG
jgi:hypothetical protein